MKSEIQKELKINAPKTTIEKNICLNLGRNPDGMSVSDLAKKLDESEGFLKFLLPTMQKKEMISLVDGKYYLNIQMVF